ncbi:hypothetical protein SAMN04487950_2737 [Halogranum rubrum]|uniref:Uncharacterized protein n=1 Tax=Halogranum rubrum TaxID=553466 RepID=A0A1I4FC35_9EURY|nr:hypothetical protein [Halogranum rubrum]SFL15089.1 hypothetical protein SAMN04487950_2737 [Halogranum rubrum]
MSTDNESSLRRLVAGPSVLVTFALLVVPLTAGSLDGRLMTPLAYPGYLIMMVGSSFGSYLFPNFALWVFWFPFVVGCYGISVVVGVLFRAVR